ncbi:type VII secretion target [Actinophytocola sp.]|uniref:type VII secretion target n=1 Tax=Actinophytocola sp. TaxID=1872138 RepID=UPI00389A7DD9
MPDHGVDLGVDLYRLYVVAKDDLPSVAAVYGDVVGKYQGARNGVDKAMTRPDHFGGGSQGPVHEAWTALHEAALKVMQDTQRNLGETATSLASAADLYAEKDGGAADEFHRLLRERGEPTPGK